MCRHSPRPTTLTIPSTTAAGLHYLIARADAANAVTETLETNNTFARTIQIGSDLHVSLIGAPAKGAAGEPIVVTDTTANQGGGGSLASTTRFYLSSDATFGAGDVLLDGSREVPELPAGASSATKSPRRLSPSTSTDRARRPASIAAQVSGTRNLDGKAKRRGPPPPSLFNADLRDRAES